jgi:hypothetical protein
MGKYQRPPFYRIFREAERVENIRIDEEDRLSMKRVEDGLN